jgi:hypothetical protein
MSNLDRMVHHTWVESRGQTHQTRWLLPMVKFAGVSPSFIVGCHCMASVGRFRSRRLRSVGRLPLQNGHPAPLAGQELTAAVHL